MSRMSEQHDDLSTIHAILLGQRKVAKDAFDQAINNGAVQGAKVYAYRIGCIDNLLLEIEVAGVVWPGNVVSLDVDPITPEMRAECCCDAFDKHGFCSCIKLDYRKCWPKEF